MSLLLSIKQIFDAWYFTLRALHTATDNPAMAESYGDTHAKRNLFQVSCFLPFR